MNNSIILIVAFCIIAQTMVNAFQPTSLRTSTRLSMMSDVAAFEQPTDTDGAPPLPTPPKRKERIPAKWLPIGGIKAPLVLDGTLAADAGFDPLG